MKNIDFVFDDGGQGYDMSAEIISDNGGIMLVELNFDFGSEIIPKAVVCKFDFDISGIKAAWSPCDSFQELRANWNKAPQYSRIASYMPIKAFIGYDDYNVYTIALSDCKTPMVLYSGVNEEEAVIDFEIKFFDEFSAPRKNYKTIIRIDRRDIPYYRAIQDSQYWWHSDCGFTGAYVPDDARMPMYSTWYSFHQNLSHDELLAECKRASKLGMKAVLIDDGWQTSDNSRGYAYCGDWEPASEKVGDMATLVDEIHKLGMKVILWYGVPFVGKYSNAAKKFEGMLLDGENDESAALDPRYPEVRTHLVELYKKAATDWGLDGFKLDFIDAFQIMYKNSPVKEGQDISSIEDAIERLLCDIITELKKINPNICIEFRHPYYGPHMLSSCNMVRVMDCPGDALKNRKIIADMRLVAGKCAVHSDMMMWSLNDTPEGAARQLINSFFGVPQVSVMLSQIPKEHTDMLKFYLDFWIKNRQNILDGEFIPLYPEQKYSLIISRGNASEIAVNYGTGVYKLERPRATLINCGITENVYIDMTRLDGYGTIDVYDCMGTHIDHISSYLDGVIKFHIPLCGMIIIKKN